MNFTLNKRERMLVLVEQWRQSGQNRKDFCLIHGIKSCTLGRWIKRSDEQDYDGSGFKEILPTSNPSQRIEIIYPNGIKICTDGDLSLIARLIHIY